MDQPTGAVVGQSSAARPPADRARVLLEINNAIVSHLDLAQVLKGVSDCLRREIKHDFAGLALYDAERHELRLHALDFPNDQGFLEKGQLIPLTGTPASLAFATRKAVLRHRPDFDEFPADIMKAAYARGIRSGCAVPLLYREKIVGSMVVASLRESAFTEDDADLLTQIARQVAIAVDNALAYERLRCAECDVVRERDRTKLLLEVNNAVASHLDLSQLLKSISATLRGIMHYDSTFLMLCQPSGKEMLLRGQDVGTFGEIAFKEGMLIPTEGTPEEQAITTGEPVLMKTANDFKRFSSPSVQYAIKHGLQSGCILPLIVHGRALGALGMVSLKKDAFTEEDAAFLMKCAGQIAIAVDNSLNFEKARQAEREAGVERDRSRLLLEVNNAVISHLTLKELLQSISASLHRILHHDAAFITLYDAGRTQLRVRAFDLQLQNKGPLDEGIVLSLDATPEGEAIRLGKPVLIRQQAELARFSDFAIRQAEAAGVHSGCAVPLIAHGQSLGALSVVSFRQEAFTEQDAKLLEQSSAQIAIAVQNALNFESARQAERDVAQERDRTRLLLEISNALVSHLDLRDLVKAICSNLQHALPHDCVGLAIHDSESGQFYSQAVSSALEPMHEDIYFSGEGTVTGVTFATGRPVYVPQLAASQFSSRITRGFVDRGLSTLYAVPLKVHGRTLGVISISSVREDAFSEADQELFQQVARHVSIAAANAISVRNLEALKEKLAREKVYLEDEIRSELNFEEIIGQSPALRQVLKLVDTVAASDSTVLLLGETGTGKELIARAVHDHSKRRSRTFVKMNCAAIPTGLLESELFGHEKGAFTGAIAQKIGRLELADQGTLFLDEVGDIPPEIQPKLLRALQEKEFERLGSTHTRRVNLRLVAATNRDLEQMTETKEFRRDLYYRLNVFPIRIPPLRERPEDIPLLVRYFVEKFSRQMQKKIESIAADTMSKLQKWQWPGNVRELENLVERAVILTTGTVLQVPIPEMKPTAAITAIPSAPSLSDGPDREQIIRIMRETRGVLAGPNGAASRLGLKRTTLQYRMKKLGITQDDWWPTSRST
jgi:formate hydrogenlyase transcriptional activator